jgi:hypothetical protein
MEARPPDFPTTLRPTSPRIAELDRLGDEIAELSAHLDAATARLLDIIREFDARGGWEYRLPLLRRVARLARRTHPGRRPRARAGGAGPRDAARPGRGPGARRALHAKVRALTRVATPETEARLLAVGRAGTAVHVERIVRGWRRVDRQAEAREAARQHAGRALHVYQGEDGTVVLRGGLTPEVGELLLRALDAARETLYQRRRATVPPASDPATEAPTRPQLADALALLAETALHRSRSPGRAVPGGSPRRCRGAGGSGATRPIRAGRGEPRSRGNIPAAGVRREPGDDAARRGGADRGGRSPGARFPRRCGGRCSIGTGAAASRDAPSGSGRGITCGTGRRAARPRWRTSRYSVAAITARCTRRATSSSVGPTGPSTSDGRTARALPDVPLPAVVPADAVGALRAQHAAKGIRLHARTGLAGWLGERLDVGWAIDVLHPLATRNVRSLPSPDGRGR